MELVKEFNHHGIPIPNDECPSVTSHVFEDNVSTLELANAHKLCPHTKHLAVQLCHFRQCTLDKSIAVEKVDTKYQHADTFTKALPCDAFQYLRGTIMGW